MVAITEFQADAVGGLHWSDCHALIDKTFAYRCLNSWGDGFVVAQAELLDFLWHEVVDGNQRLGVEVDILFLLLKSLQSL